MEDTICIPVKEYNQLKMQANMDIELLKQLVDSLKDIKEGRVRKVK